MAGTAACWELTLLGNAGEPFDISEVDMFPLPTPAFSFCALFMAAQEKDKAPA